MPSRCQAGNYLNKLNSEVGSVLLWTLGLGIMAVGVMNFSLSLLNLSNEKSELRALADSIVLNSLNRLDFDTFIVSGKLVDIEVDIAMARSWARSEIKSVDENVTLKSLSLSLDKLTVKLQKPVELWNFLGLGYLINLQTSSSAQLVVE
jgi:hypothetical protein